MFDLFDLFRLFVSALFILPVVTIIRESGYYLVVTLLGAKEKKLTIGSGPILFTMPTVEVRRYFFMYSWLEYEDIRTESRFWHGLIYASPMLSNLIAGVIVNSLLAGDMLPGQIFWETFVFYVFYFVLFDALPVYLPDGQPTNGRAIFDLLWHGKRSDFMKKEAEEDGDEKANTDAQEETMENRNRDQGRREAEDKNGENEDGDQGRTEAQEETIENRDRDQRERDDHTDPA
ncbi:hypothetical protein [Shouchella shacheensis]|uniref:hypothetical protein n=1 Tax=Shouchella shacheensis TaxID=1649580 RepID=UPI000A917D7B|nr:hypothetical protein [Shouchella shacheensis]